MDWILWYILRCPRRLQCARCNCAIVFIGTISHDYLLEMADDASEAAEIPIKSLPWCDKFFK